MRIDSKSLMAAIAIAAASAAVPQEAPKRRNVQGDAAAIVTQAECAAAMARMEGAVLRVAGVSTTLPRMAAGSGPAKRSEILARFDRVFELIRPKIKFTPKRIVYDAKLFALPANHPQRTALEKLVKWGCVSKAGPLATAKTDELTLIDFGDALGLFMARVADITHRPDPKFSPYLSGS